MLFTMLGCGSPASTNPADYVGEYVFKPFNSDPGTFADFLILKSDSTAIEIRYSKTTGQMITAQTKWDLSSRNGEYVGIRDFSHPVEGSRSEIKLGINDDLGQYYLKVR
jgi:hypothetical protein